MNDAPTILVCAAGASTRMGPGRDKLLEPVGGVPILARVAGIAAASGLRVIVTLPADRPGRLRALSGIAVERLIVHDAIEGMAASFRAGVRAAGKAPALLTLLADMPEIDGSDIATVLAAWRADPARPARGTSAEGIPGQPVIFPARLFGALAALRGDTGGRDVLKGEAPRLVPLPGQRAITDLDTPEDWAAWRARNPGM